MFLLIIISLAIAYILGSLSSAIIICKLLGLPDPRTEGSQNPGTTNVLRIAGPKAAALTLLGDTLKGFIPVLLARLFQIEGFTLSLVALFAVLGHIFPVFFQWKGGKGIATAFGSILALSFSTGLLLVLIWVVIVATTAYVSLASLIAAVFAPLIIIFRMGLGPFVPIFIMSGFIILQHRDNIRRLRAGSENKIDIKSPF